MRTNKAIKNASIGIVTYLLAFIPQFLLRKILLDTLGEDILGLNSLFTNLIGYLSIIEMGIGSAIIFSLYEPFVEGNKVKIKGYLNYYSRVYKISGTIIFLCGILMLPILPMFIENGTTDIKQAQWYFILFLCNTYCTYLFTYKFCILIVEQENYRISIVNTAAKIIIAMLQYFFLLINPRFDTYILIQIVVNLIQFTLLNFYINNKHQWLKNTKGVLSKSEKNELIRNVKALFFHKIGSIFVFGTDNLVISAFINLAAVARYNNYNMIFTALQGFINTAMNAITPSIGNLLVENNPEQGYKIHQRLFFLNFWISSCVVITLFNVSSQFITLWLGSTATINHFTLIILLLNLYFSLMRGPVECFQAGSGHYHEDRYASIFEGVINLLFSILLVRHMGLTGVFIGTLISNILVIFWVKPLVIYKYVFHRPLIDYFKVYLKYILIGLLPLGATIYFTQNIRNCITFPMVLINCCVNIIIINIIYIVIFWKNNEFLYFKDLILKFIR